MFQECLTFGRVLALNILIDSLLPTFMLFTTILSYSNNLPIRNTYWIISKQYCNYSINNDGGRSPDLLLSSKDGFSSNGVSPRHSVSSNSSNGSTISNTKVNSLSTKTDKKTGFQKLTRLLSNNSNGKVSNTINWKGTSGQQQQQHHHSNQSQAPLVIVKESHNISDSSCFFWNHHKNQNKLKRTGSVDSMLSHVGGSSNVDQSMTTTTATKNENDTNQSTSHKQSSSGSSWHTPNRLLKASPVFSTKSSTYYLGSEIPVPSSTVLLPPAPSSPGPITNHGSSFYGTRSGVHKIPGKRQMSIDINAMPVETLKKSDRKRWEKLSKFNFDQQALFSAVENENFERTQLVVQTTDVDLNSTNSDGFTPLDISLMLLNIPIIKYLQSCGAKEISNRVAKRERHLCQLLNEAERCVHDLTNCSRQSSIGNGSLSSALLKEKERQLVFWERQPPPPPLSVHVEVKGATSLLVHYFPPIRLQEKRNIITKYKIDWSDNSFETVLGSVEINNLASKHEYVIENLESERCYQVRIASSNCKAWRSIDRKASTFSSSDRVMEIDDLFRQIINSKQVTENELKRLSIDTEAGAALPPSSLQSQKRVRKSIKNFFGAANKFQRVMKRGIFFASLIYHEHRVLVTNDEVLPIIEIDDIYPSTLQNDFYWLLKIACTWDDIKMFRRDMEKSQSSVAHFRTRILLAIEQMQSSLGLSDLGQLFYKPLRDSEGTVVLCTIRALSDPKQISCLSLRWLPLVKLHKRMYQQQQAAQSQQQAILQKESFSERVSDSGISLGGCEYSPRLIGNILVRDDRISSSIASQLYLSTLQQQKEVIESKVDSGSTYGNYLNANSPTPSINQSDNQSVGMISPIHSNRANHLSQLFQLAINGQQSSNVSSLTNPITIQKLTFSEKLSFQQLLKFLQMLSQTAGHFLQSIGVTDGEHADAHRLYSLEVIELSSDVSLILLLPPVDEVCSMFNHSDSLNQVPNLIYLPLKIFELIHMNTYQPNFTGRYSRISAMLESDIMVAQQAQREAFSSAEVKTAKARVNQLQEFQTQLDEYCRSMRWIMDVVAFARDRQLAAGIPLFDVQYTLNCVDKQLLEEDNDDRLFHVPAISLSTPSDHPIINIQSECNSTPSSPPAISPSPSSMGRRKSRDDSFLEEHHRLQNRFNSVHHHRFHNQYGCSHQKNGTAFPFHCDSLESGCNDLDQLLPANMNPSVLVDTNATDNLPNMGSHYGLETMEGGCSSGASSETHDQNNEPPQAAKEDNEYSKSSFSLQTEHIVGFSQPRGSLMVDKSLLEDMRRCVSASKLIERTGSDDSPNSISTPPPSNHAGLIHRRMTSAANYFFTNDCDDIDTESINPPSDHHRPSVNSIDSFSEMSIGGSQISLISSSHNQSIDIDYCNVPMFSNSKPTEFGEIYRPLSRLLMLSNENLDQPPLFEEEEEEMPIPERLVKQQSIENENKMNESNVESINPINVQLDIPQLRIWSDSTESIPKKLEEEFLASETIDLNIPEPETELTSVESENSPNLIEVDSNLSFFNDNFIDLLSNYVQPESTSTEMLSKPIIPNQNKPSIKLNKMFYSGDSSISKKKNFEINLQQNDKRLNQLHYRNDDNFQ
ncbi:Ankyrin-repeat and fibronectin type III domain-containing 1 [Blomia tropicalis]|nr:Ankyrin-repeat and fibronectin type III domain-containing 1 [Blomia tropicalis]